MKKIYKKPLITVEELTLDYAIAANCTANKQIMESLIKDFFGFTESMDNCTTKLDEIQGYTGLWQDTDFDGELDAPNAYGDQVCYHSNIGKAFLS